MELLGVRLPDPVASLGRLGRGLTGVALEAVSTHRPRRLVWSCPGRIYIEAHGVHGPGGKRVARRIERALQDQPGVPVRCTGTGPGRWGRSTSWT